MYRRPFIEFTSSQFTLLNKKQSIAFKKYIGCFLFIYNNVKDDINDQINMFDEENSNKLYIKTIDSIIFKYFNQYKNIIMLLWNLHFKKNVKIY